MAKKEQKEAVLNVLTRDGLSIDQIRDVLGFAIEKRTLQRWLKDLREQDRITVLGEARATRYLLKEQTKFGEEEDSKSGIIPLSAEGNEILALVSRPLNKRIPVGYQRGFLESYRPNIDSYLTVKDKERLAELGKTQGDNQPAGTYARQILNRLLIDLSWNSSRLEGNTYSLLDTELLIHEGKSAEDKSPRETQMILNHKDAIEFLVDTFDEIGLNRYTLLNLHGLLSNNLLPNRAASGRLREFGVGITGSVFTPLGVPQLISEFFHLILEKANKIDNPFEQVFFMLVHFPYLQPFEDVNKRVSRLAANIPLNLHNLAPLSFVDVPEAFYVKGILGIYELNRVELFKDVFMWAYERSAFRYAAVRQSVGEPDTFHLKYREEIRDVILRIVLQLSPKREAAQMVKNESMRIPKDERAKFVEAVETELMTMHEGNFARYRISPAEFRKWQAVWSLVQAH